MSKFRIRPTIGYSGVTYIIEKKGFLFWSIDKSKAGSIVYHSMCGGLTLKKHYKNPQEAIKAVNREYGFGAYIEDYAP